MGNTHVKPHPRNRNKKQVHWKAADCPSPPGKPQLLSEVDATPDLITIRWTKPTKDGGSPIIGYLVEHRRTGSPHWVRATPSLVPYLELTIGGLEPGWKYQFRVSAENAVGVSNPSELSEPVTVTLQRSAVTAPRFLQDLQDATALENERFEVVVNFVGQPAPKVCWFKDGFEIFSSRRIRILTEYDKSILTIHQCALSDEGEIKCTATNRAGHVSTKAQLTVEAPPSIRLPRQYEDGLLFEIGELIRLKVSVAGRPTPSLYWMHNGESIENNDRYEIKFTDKSSILKINEATRTDRGEYQIKAINKLGEDLTSFLVTVTDKPSPPGRARVIMTLGKSVTLSWSTPSDDGGCKIGNYIIEYYRLGWDVWLKAATSRQLTTILGDLIEGSEYKFRIKAESPYGVSEPSEESEIIFIPDPKRGITKPEIRGRSQPREISVSAPVAAKRKNKRSQSSSRAEERETALSNSNSGSADIPQRPDRNRIKSPPKTPELSVSTNRKEIIKSEINKAIFDRASMARDLAYGSPEMKVQRELENPTNSSTYSTTSSEKSKSPTPEPVKLPEENLTKLQPLNEIKKQRPFTPPVKAKSPSPSKEIKISSPESRVSSNLQRNKSPRENNENFTGSSEFMLVLYSDENAKGHGSTSDIFDFDDNSIPPPMSLSAPELGIEPPQMFGNLKLSASSTELLHERAMLRFYQAAEAEEAELERRRKSNETRKLSADIPKIQINSQDNQEIIGLDKSHSFRRRLSGGISQQQALWAQRRQSLKSPKEITEITEISPTKLLKSPISTDERRELMMLRQRSESEEREEEAFEKVRANMGIQGQSSFEKKTIKIADEENWDEDYEESLSEEETESSSEEDVRKFEKQITSKSVYESDDEDTYHPELLGDMKKNPDNEPFEILTVRKSLPDPNFVPKPILKKTDHDENIQEIINEPISNDIKTKVRSLSPIPKSLTTRSLPDHILNPLPENPADLDKLDLTNPSSKPDQLKPSENKPPPSIFSPLFGIAAVAQITGITAASVVIPQRLLEKKIYEEEAKVVIDHYGDIVKNYGSKNKTTPKLYLDRDSLKQVAENSEDLENKTDVKIESAVKPIKQPPVTVHSYDTVKKDDIVSKENIPVKQKEPIETLSMQIVSKKEENTVSQTDVNKEKKSRFFHHQQRKSTPSHSPTRRTSSINKRTTSKSPARPENWSVLKSNANQNQRKSSPSPARKELIRRKSKSPSPIPPSKRRPMLREIMTQTSVGFESFSSSLARGSISEESTQRQEELLAQAEVKVRSVFDYVTDLAMFAVACWFYLFNNELFAIPILFVMVYRQLKMEISKRIPNWILRRIKRKKKE